MAERVWNFSAGPATLPAPVLDGARAAVAELGDSGMSVLEVSHRSRIFGDVIAEAERGIRELLGVPRAGYQVLFLQGGASLQFSMVPMSLLLGGRPAEYVVTGTWGTRAVVEAERHGAVTIPWTGAGEGFVRVPRAGELAGLGEGAAYVHLTSNETIQGVEWPTEPAVAPGTPLVGDLSSDFLSRPVEIARYGLIYAGAQKNAGSAGVTIVVVREDLVAEAQDGLPTMLDYRTYAEHHSLYNTPPVFAVFVVMLVTRWLRDEIGGLAAMAAINEEKAGLLYEAIDSSGGFYEGHADPGSRSRMNVTWRLPTPELEREFVTAAAERGLLELKGHRSVGGIRASIYNAMPAEGVLALRGLMDSFRRRS